LCETKALRKHGFDVSRQTRVIMTRFPQFVTIKNVGKDKTESAVVSLKLFASLFAAHPHLRNMLKLYLAKPETASTKDEFGSDTLIGHISEQGSKDEDGVLAKHLELLDIIVNCTLQELHQFPCDLFVADFREIDLSLQIVFVLCCVLLSIYLHPNSKSDTAISHE